MNDSTGSPANAPTTGAPLRIVIVGAGNVGRGLGTAALTAGHRVTYAVREGSDRALPDGAGSTTVAGAADAADLTILAVPFGVAAPTLQRLAPPGGAVVVDATNPFGATIAGGHSSGAAALAASLPSVRLVKAFNVFGAEHMSHPELPDGSRPVMPVACDDDDARRLVADLGRELGFDAVEVGGLNAAAVMEEAARYWGLLAMSGGLGREVVLVAHRRGA